MDSVIYPTLHHLAVRPVWKAGLRIAHVAILAVFVFAKRRDGIQRRIELLPIQFCGYMGRYAVRFVTGRTVLDVDTHRRPSRPKARVLTARRGGGTDAAPSAGGDTRGCTLTLALIAPQSEGT